MTRALPLLLLGSGLILPVAIGEVFYVNIASQILVAAIFASSLNVLVGYGGLTSLGHAAYLGAAAYVVAWLTVRAGWSFMPAAGMALAVTTTMAGVFGALALRGVGISFLMITLALGQTLWGVAFRWSSVTGGDNGIPGVPRPALFGLSLAEPTAFYLATCALFAAALAAMHVFLRSGLGISLQGTRDQPRRMAMLGHHVWLVRWLAFVFSGFWAAVAGVAFVAYHGFIHPQTLALPHSAEALLMVIAGGAGTLAGPVLGAALVVLLKLIVSAYLAQWLLLLGVIFIVIVILLPEGLAPGLARALRRVRRGRAREATP